MRKKLNKIWSLLDGKKTYVGAVIIFIAGGFNALGKLENNVFEAIVAFGGAVSAFGLRDALKKLK